MPNSLESDKLNRIVSFLTEELRPSCNWTIQDEYPQVFQERNIHNLKYIEKEGRPVTHAALRPLIMRTPQMLYKVGAIGSVVTDPSYRGQGLSSQVINDCLEEALRQDCDIAILWTNLHDFYRRLGFELAGFEEYFVIESPLASDPQNLRFINSTQIDPDAILKLYNRHTITSLRSADEIRKYLSIPNTQVYTAWDSTSSIKAYAVIGKGADLEGFVHEWGGDIPSLIALFNFILSDRKMPFTLLTGAQSINLIMTLQKNKINGRQGYLGMIKILNIPKFAKKIEKFALQLGVSNFAIQIDQGGKTRVTLNKIELVLDKESDLARLVFGPTSSLKLAPDMAEIVNKVFPLPLWVWGWDSI